MILTAQIFAATLIYLGFRFTGRSFVWGWCGGVTVAFAIRLVERLLS